jgi:hypothetical protein
MIFEKVLDLIYNLICQEDKQSEKSEFARENA